MSYLIEKKHQSLFFTINRAQRRNAIDYDVMEGLKQFANQLHEDPTIHYGVITGSGEEAFCSGGDLQIFHQLETEEAALSMLKPMSEILLKIANAPVPTIAIVNGHAVGGGCEIATMCDFRIVHEKAKAGFIQGRLAITSGWGGATYLFEKLPNKQDAFHMLLEAHPFSAQQLKQLQWADRLYDGSVDEAFLSFVQTSKITEPTVLRAYKSRYLQSIDHLKREQLIAQEISECAKLWEQPAHHEAVQRFLNK